MAKITVRYHSGAGYDSFTEESYIILDAQYRAGWEFKGWATTYGTTEIAYSAGDVLQAGNTDTVVDLYAVFVEYIYCYYYRNRTAQVETNVREKKHYYNTGAATASEVYNTFTLPAFSDSNTVIAPDSADVEWTAIGWRNDESAGVAQFAAGESVTMNPYVEAFHAVYMRTATVSYNSNGGSGSMSPSTGTAYYNCSGDTLGATITLRTCTFTSPGGLPFNAWSTDPDASGNWYRSTITTSVDVVLYAIWGRSRPSDWSWESTVSKGSAIRMTAAEFNRFIDRIYEFAAYRGASLSGSAGSYYVTKGSDMLASEVNAVRALINAMSPPTAPPGPVSSDSTITAAFFNGLRDSLNSIV